MTGGLGGVGQIVGLVLFAAVGMACLGALIRAGSRHGLLAPVVVGLVIRAIVLVVTQLTSAHGLVYTDAVTYNRVGSAIATQWLHGHIINPSNAAGSEQFGYQTLLAVVYMMTGTSVVAGKAVNVLLGSATILMVGLLARRLFGGRAYRQAAWLMALTPTAVWWSAVLLKEALATFLIVLAVLSVLKWPARRWVLASAASLGILMITRSPAVAAVLLMMATVAMVAAIRHPDAVDPRGLLTYAGLAVGLLALEVVGLSGGHPVYWLSRLSGTFGSLSHRYGVGVSAGSDHYISVAKSVVDIPKTLVSPYPWIFTHRTDDWDRALYPGMWLWYLLLPTIALGIWRMRRHVELLVLALPAATLLVLNAFSTGFTFRQRSTIEPFLLLLFVAGADTWRRVLTRGAGALGLVAIAATVQSRSLIVGVSVIAFAGCVFIVARRVPPDLALAVPIRTGVVSEVLARLRRPSVRGALAWMPLRVQRDR